MDNQLDEILSGNDEVTPVAAETPASEATVETPPAEEVTPPAQPRGPDGKFAPKEQPAAETPPATDPPLDHPALLGERRRRQELEQQLRELQERIAPQQQPQAAPQAQDAPPDRWEDPDGYDRWLVAQAAQAARAEAMQAFQTQRIEASANAFRGTVPDYDEKIAVFGQMLNANPGLRAQLEAAPDPAKYAYNAAKTQMEVSQYGSLEELVNARVREALKAVQTPTAQPIPTTLAAEQSLRGSATGEYQPPSLEDILAPQRR